MKGHDKVIEWLNELLKDELTAINQYMVHAEMCENWGYARLHERVEKRAFTEMRHAEKLIERILFLEGFPVVSSLGGIYIGKTVEEQLRHDLNNEAVVRDKYNRAIQLCSEVLDTGSRELLKGILEDEEKHIDELEAYFDQIGQVGIGLFLSQQIRGGKES